jgi:dipeptidyl-peptidase 4
MDIKVSKNGNFISYINNNNIFILEISSLKEYQITNTTNTTSGVAEFIIQEEFSRYSGNFSLNREGYWWNNEENNILYLEVDESMVDIIKISESLESKGCDEYSYPR